ncbi:MAG TPA: hypothetical protein VHG52_11245, partial [Thermomicrobiales bacterium]|nr:hypothetical protein [Thermomicrobiales bacterium]
MGCGEALDMQPRGTKRLVLGIFDYEVCATGIRCFIPVAASAARSVTPAAGARSDATTGLLTINA